MPVTGGIDTLALSLFTAAKLNSRGRDESNGDFRAVRLTYHEARLRSRLGAGKALLAMAGLAGGTRGRSVKHFRKGGSAKQWQYPKV